MRDMPFLANGGMTILGLDQGQTERMIVNVDDEDCVRPPLFRGGGGAAAMLTGNEPITGTR